MSAGDWHFKKSNIWHPSHDHKDGMCRVDRAWFDKKHLELLLKQFPQTEPESDTILIPEKVKVETEGAFHTFEFGIGIPFHSVISKESLKGDHFILFKREKP